MEKHSLEVKCRPRILAMTCVGVHFAATVQCCTRGKRKMTKIITMAAAVALMALATSAQAFQEQSTGVAPAQRAAPGVESDAAALGLQTPEALERGENGTEVRIPGLGKLGVLPKMDFGLELLYGAAETPTTDDRFAAPDPDGDLKVRGEIKHRF